MAKRRLPVDACDACERTGRELHCCNCWLPAPVSLGYCEECLAHRAEAPRMLRLWARVQTSQERVERIMAELTVFDHETQSYRAVVPWDWEWDKEPRLRDYVAEKKPAS